MEGGLLLGLIGVWLLCQVIGGDALARAGIADADPKGGTAVTPTTPGGTVPGPGQPMPASGGGSW